MTKLPPPFYESRKVYQMNKRGRPNKYLTIERFEKFIGNDFHHLQSRVYFNSKLLWIILGGLIVAALIDRLV